MVINALMFFKLSVRNIIEEICLILKERIAEMFQ